MWLAACRLYGVGGKGDLGEARSTERRINTATGMAHLLKYVLICGCLDDVNDVNTHTYRDERMKPGQLPPGLDLENSS